MTAEFLARLFHITYERNAAEYGYETRPESRVPWGQVPPNNQRVMLETARQVLETINEERDAFANQRAAEARAEELERLKVWWDSNRLLDSVSDLLGEIDRRLAELRGERVER